MYTYMYTYITLYVETYVVVKLCRFLAQTVLMDAHWIHCMLTGLVYMFLAI